MDHKYIFALPQFSAILTFVDAIFRELNIGLLIYWVENPQEIASAKLIYANAEASRCTGTDLGLVVGKRIFEAFPGLEGTHAADTFGEVVIERVSRRVGVVEYADGNVRHGNYLTRAFPMPSDCFGVIFDDRDAAASSD